MHKNPSYLHNIEELLSKNIKYVLSIGKRQPMHMGHKASLARILQLKGIRLIYVMGSSNLKSDPLFDPVTNPLTVEQQIKQFQIVFPKANPIFLPIIDIKDMSLWGEIIILALAELGIKPSECAIHFIGKEEDKLTEEVSFVMENGKKIILNLGQWLIEALVHWGFYMWFDQTKAVDLSLSARNFRMLDLEHLSDENRKLLAAPEYLREIARAARKLNSNENGPVTLRDLTLQRIKDY